MIRVIVSQSFADTFCGTLTSVAISPWGTGHPTNAADQLAVAAAFATPRIEKRDLRGRRVDRLRL